MSAGSNSEGNYHFLLESPAYPIAEASRLVRLSSGQIRRWLRGYEFDYLTKGPPQIRHSQKPPVVPGTARETPFASFLDLIDLILVREFLQEGFTLQQLRLIFAEAKEILEIDHLAYETFFTIGRSVFLETSAKSMVALSTGGQLAIDEFIRSLGHQIEFDEETKLAVRWYPLHPDRNVVVDPTISFGHPVISGRRVTTSNIYDFYQAEHGDIDVICDWMDVEQVKVKSAIDFELQLAA